MEGSTAAFEHLEQILAGIGCLAHYMSNYSNVTTTASTKILVATLWQEHSDRKLIVWFASPFRQALKNIAMGELELLAVVWCLKISRLIIYGTHNKLHAN